MTKPDRKSEAVQDDVRAAVEAARPDQIKRLLRDIMNVASNDDFKPTGHA